MTGGFSLKGIYLQLMIYKWLSKQVNKLKKEENGMGVVEIALIIVILISLAILFRTKIEAFLAEIFNNFNAQALYDSSTL